MVAVRKDRRRVEVLRDASRQLRTFHRACPMTTFCCIGNMNSVKATALRLGMFRGR